MKKLSTAKQLISKTAFLVVSITTFISLSNCSQRADMPLKAFNYGKTILERCVADTLNQYHILVPEKIDPGQKLPLVVVLDAHGDGKLAVDKFRLSVLYFPCLVAGSDLIKNNFPGFENTISQLISDIKNKFSVDEKQLIIAGFSGGARMAYYYSLNHQVEGVLMCGAGPGQEKPSCPIYTISGMGDFNFSEQYRHPEIQAFKDDLFTSDYFHGIHEWPKPQQLSDGLLVLMGRDENLKNIRMKRSGDLLLLVDSLKTTGDQLMIWKALEKAAKLAVTKTQKRIAIKNGNLLLKTDTFKNTITSLETDLNKENRLKRAYAQRSLTENMVWWKNELTALTKNLETYKTGLKADHFMRIKGFIGILLYSRINKMIYDDPRNPQLENLLETYAFAEPENSYAWYFKALHNYQNGDKKLSIKYLDKALNHGFSDQAKMKEDFAEDFLQQINE